jgi:U3 small nucleolar RNA-associated protein 24
LLQQGKVKKTRKFAEVKRIMGPNDARLKQNQEKEQQKEEKKQQELVRHM